jgi:uncharacterized membrane protein
MYISVLIDVLVWALEFVGVLIIIWGAAYAVIFLVTRQKPKNLPLPKAALAERLRIAFGQKIVFALEFLVAADILKTLKDPNVNESIRLAILVVIRVILSYFIDREIHQHTLKK